MTDLYGRVDVFCSKLDRLGFTEQSGEIREAKLSGSMASEILGLVLLALKRVEHGFKGDDLLRRECAELIQSIEATLG